MINLQIIFLINRSLARAIKWQISQQCHIAQGNVFRLLFLSIQQSKTQICLIYHHSKYSHFSSYNQGILAFKLQKSLQRLIAYQVNRLECQLTVSLYILPSCEFCAHYPSCLNSVPFGGTLNKPGRWWFGYAITVELHVSCVLLTCSWFPATTLWNPKLYTQTHQRKRKLLWKTVYCI